MGNWELLEPFRDARSHKKWRCRCRCKKKTRRDLFEQTLREGRSLSCGCQRNQRISAAKTRHGEARQDVRTREYRIWANMLTRCRNENDAAYKDYGGRGIRVCKRWLRYENFLADMGRCPGPGYSVDRKKNWLGYSKANCRWATDREQGNNTRRNRWIVFRGRRQTLTQWSRELHVSPEALRARLDRRGWSKRRALTTPGRTISYESAA